MEDNVLLAKKSLSKRNIKYLIIILVAVTFIATFFIYYFLKGPKNIANCKDLECVKVFASDENFILEDCESVMPEFKDSCYYIFATENPNVGERKPQEYCMRISYGDLYVECLEYATGTSLPSPRDPGRLREALMSQNKEKCLELRMEEMREQCLKDVMLISNAIEKKDISLCGDSEMSPDGKNICFPLLSEITAFMEREDQFEN